jgi:ketosteroid isomerase-like protein
MRNVNIVKRTYEAFSRGDMQAVLAAMDPKIEWREAEGNPYMPSGEAWIGPDEIVENLFMKLGTDWDPFIFQPEKYHDGGDTIVIEGRYTGKNNKTGKKMDLQVCHIWEVKGGKLTKFQQYINTAKLQNVMGVLTS